MNIENLWKEIEQCGIIPSGLGNCIESFRSRQYFIKEYSWAIPSKKSINELVEIIGNKKVLEIGAGTGLWAYLLSYYGINIIATDISPPNYCFTKVEKLNSELAAKKYKYDVLFICWSHFESDADKEAIENFNGDLIINVGESEGGCTGQYFFTEKFIKSFHLHKEIVIPNWYGIHDCVQVYKRIKKE